MQHTILIAAAGSGGHLIPAQVVAQELKNEGVSICFAGHNLSQNPYFDHEKWQFFDVPAAPPSSRKPFHFIRSTISGIKNAWGRLDSYPLIVGFGSYHTVPLLTAATLKRTPFILYEANAVAGKVIRLFAPFSTWTGCFFEETYLRGQKKIVAHPTRPAFLNLPPKEKAIAHYGLSSPTILVVGGSQGASIFNLSIPIALSLLEYPVHVLHVAGNNANIEKIQKEYNKAKIPAHVCPYEQNMHMAYAASDLVISRAGASAINEVEKSQKPAIYIPYPHASNNHQKKNAMLASKRGAAIVIDEQNLTPPHLARSINKALEQSDHHNKIYHPQTKLSTMILKTLSEVSKYE